IARRLSIFFDAAAIFRSPPAFFIVVSPVMSMLRPELFIPWTPERSTTIFFLRFSVSECSMSLRTVASGPPRTLPSSSMTVIPSISLFNSFIFGGPGRYGAGLSCGLAVREIKNDGAGDIDRRVRSCDDADGKCERESPVHFSSPEEKDNSDDE